MIGEDFRRWPQFDKTARVASHSPIGVIELMPISDGRQYAFKYVNGHPQNTRDGLLTVTAFGVLSDVDTGYPRILSELTLTTALRTAATSVLAAQHLARPGSRCMALIGNGAQSEFQAIGFHCLMGIEELRVYDVDPLATDKLVRNLLAYPDLHIYRASSTADAVCGADIVTTVTADKTNALILTPDMIVPGMHLNAVGGDCPGKTELHADILHGAKVVVEYEPQSRIEGELQQMPPDFAVTELWQVLNGQTPVRIDARQVTVFDSVGFALEDFSAMRYLEKHVLKDATRVLDLIPELLDPKDLYGMGMARSSAPTSATAGASSRSAAAVC
jgi:ornithine cyclodeaminase